MNLVTTDKLTIGYDGKPLIKDISLKLKKGEIVTLIGPNGSGKTTLLKTMAGLLNNISGYVFVSGRDLKELSGNDRAKLMSVMLTEKGGYEYSTCKDIVSLGRYPYTPVLGKLSMKDDNIIRKAMELVNVSELADREYAKISDGQRQRVLLARSLAQEPEFMLLDEPTSFLDVGYKLEFMNVLKGLARDSQIGILMSLHELDLAYSVSDVIISVSADNSIDKIGRPEEILTGSYISDLFNIKHGSYSIENGFSLEKSVSSIPQCKQNKESGTRYIMVQGTMSSVGKSLVVAGLCRIFKQDGYKTVPFKSQNMALNSYITEDGLEMGRAQVMQAEAAGVKPDVHMNPILLKPTGDASSQVIVNGEVYGNMPAVKYFEYKKELIPVILESVEYLSRDNDIVVIEGAGSPAEINLKKNDIVNMGMADLVDSPVILVGDIDKGGVFAQLLGTLELLESDECSRVKGLIVNKFRGDKSILAPGIEMLEEKAAKKVVGVLPYMNISLEDEDSLTERFNKVSKGLINIAVIKFPHISNFTDFNVFEQLDEVSVCYTVNRNELSSADLVILPGSKNTISDFRWLRENGLDLEIKRLADKGTAIIGICGGYQMLGELIKDPRGIECAGEIEGLKLLNISTLITNKKERKQVNGKLPNLSGLFEKLSGIEYYGYEIHMGVSEGNTDIICQNGNVYGTYVHGIFDNDKVAKTVIDALAKKKSVEVNTKGLLDYREYKEREYDRLADIMRKNLDMNSIYKMMGIDR